MLLLTLLMAPVVLAGNQSEYSSSVIDISRWQVKVDFSKVKKDGIVAVIHKATQGTDYVDPTYCERRRLAQRQGLLWGAYHFAEKGSPQEQADHFLKTVGDTCGVLLALDLEDRGKNMSPDEAVSFVKRIKEKTGRYPVVYGSQYYLEPFNKGELSNCSLWIARYTTNARPDLPSNRKSWVLWQYTDGERGGTPRYVDGIGFCDRDRYNGTEIQLRAKWPNL